MGLISYSQIQDGTTATASQVNTPLTTIYNEFNGNISGVNFADGAITNTKIANGAVTPAKLDTTNSKFTFSKVTSTTTAASITINSDNADMHIVTALGETTTINAPTGTPVDGQNLVIRIKATGAARTVNWNAAFRAVGVTLPTSVPQDKTYYVGCKYNTADSKWDVLAIGRQG
jgi:hypothetical protein